MAVIQIGRCIGCNKMGRLDDGVGKCCLEHPKRGRKWAITASKLRKDEFYRQFMYDRISPKNRAKFIEMFGDVKNA